MYANIALGKSSAMDVVGGESSGMPGQLLALLPGLFSLQGWQVYMGVKMVVQTGWAVVNSEGWLVCPSMALSTLLCCCAIFISFQQELEVF
jgi:hypothetical protein